MHVRSNWLRETFCCWMRESCRRAPHNSNCLQAVREDRLDYAHSKSDLLRTLKRQPSPAHLRGADSAQSTSHDQSRASISTADALFPLATIPRSVSSSHYIIAASSTSKLVPGHDPSTSLTDTQLPTLITRPTSLTKAKVPAQRV
jgi:hypothetical protein